MMKNGLFCIVSRLFDRLLTPALSATVLFLVFSTGLTAHASVIRAKNRVNFDGSSNTVDSFDSADPAHSTNGLYPFSEPEKILAHGDVLTSATVSNAISVGDTLIKGRVATGPNGMVGIGPDGSVGDRAWVEEGNFGIQSGHFTDDQTSTYPSVTLPVFSLQAAFNNLTINGKTYSKAIIYNGDYLLAGLSGSLYISTNITCRILVSASVNLVNDSDEIRVARGAQVKLYMSAATFSVKGLGIINDNGNADSFTYLGTSLNTSITLRQSFTGAIYAPNADFSYGGSNSPVEFIGCSMTKSLGTTGEVHFHFDENLYRVGPFAPTITNSPQSQTVLPGESATFTGGGTGPGPFGYQWAFLSSGWVSIPGATNATLTLTNVSLAQAGSYALFITNAFGSASAEASLTISPSPTLVQTAANPFQFSVTGIPGYQYAVESSTNLADWERISTNTAPFTVVETNLEAFPQRFYRAVYLP